MPRFAPMMFPILRILRATLLLLGTWGVQLPISVS